MLNLLHLVVCLQPSAVLEKCPDVCAGLQLLQTQMNLQLHVSTTKQRVVSLSVDTSTDTLPVVAKYQT